MSSPHETLVRAIASEAARRVAARAKRQLRKMAGGLSGDESGLKTAWDEFCVQVQGEHSLFWDDYVLTVKQCIQGSLLCVSNNDRSAIYLQTNAGREWASEHETDRELPPLDEDEVVDHVYGTLWRLADEDRSVRVTHYLQSRYEHD